MKIEIKSGFTHLTEEREGELAEQILNILSKQKFADFYASRGPFEHYLTGEDEDGQTPVEEQREKILLDIKKIFQLPPYGKMKENL